MFRTINRPTLAAIVVLSSLAVTLAARAQTTGAADAPRPKKSAAASKAEENYKNTCQACHLADGKGLTPDMSFTDGVWKHGSTTEAIARTIREGVKDTLMVSFKDKFSDAEIVELARLVRSFDPKKPAPKPKK